ncbi:MAG: bifunctional folylpolyglutamate synthase/dihydrofolate synthase [Cyclonatronaceae bacterium]
MHKNDNRIIRYLNSLPRFQTAGASAANFSLDAIRAFCAGMGNPEQSFRAVHIAGTNGKGTTAHMLHAVYMEAGYRTGLFTSPHLLQFNERIRINGHPVPDNDLGLFFDRYEDLIRHCPLTYFELSAAMAFWYFRHMNVDIAIIETGLGGRLDATNIIIPACSVITSIGLDHTEILGPAISDIAREKGGIIKPGVPVVTGNLAGEAMQVTEEIAKKNRSPLIRSAGMNAKYVGSTLIGGITCIDHPEFGPMEIHCDIPGSVQRLNIAVAASVVLTLAAEFPVQKEALLSGLSGTAALTGLPGRYERLDHGRNWFFDGGHNNEALTHLAALVDDLGGAASATAVIALNADKATDEVLDFYRAFKSVYYYRMDGERSAEFDRILQRIPDAVSVNSEFRETTGPLWHLNRKELVIFSGSFYFYPVVKRWLASLESR